MIKVQVIICTIVMDATLLATTYVNPTKNTKIYHVEQGCGFRKKELEPSRKCTYTKPTITYQRQSTSFFFFSEKYNSSLQTCLDSIGLLVGEKGRKKDKQVVNITTQPYKKFRTLSFNA